MKKGAFKIELVNPSHMNKPLNTRYVIYQLLHELVHQPAITATGRKLWSQLTYLDIGYRNNIYAIYHHPMSP